MILRDNKIEKKFAPGEEPLSFSIGWHFETIFKPDEKDYEREKEIRVQLTPEVEFIGHADFVSSKAVYELKSVTSENTYKKVFPFTNSRTKQTRPGTPKPENVIQLVTYMYMLGINTGYLVYGSWAHIVEYKELNKDSLSLIKNHPPEIVKFKVTIKPNGDVWIDDKKYIFSTQHIRDYCILAAELLRSNTLYHTRPLPIEPGSFTSACSFCPLNDLCNSLESREISFEEFLNLSKELFNV